jgi:hypothetical protein
VNEFVDECRREWRRIGVPDPVANEMAADLTADLEEAASEGASPEDVLGNSAFDPRRFAAAWAAARGVTNPPPLDHRTPWRPPWAMALSAVLVVLIVFAGLALLVGSGAQSISVATRRIVAGPGPLRLFGPGSPRLGPGRFAFPVVQDAVHPLAFLVLVFAVVGLAVLAVVYWWPGSPLRRFGRRPDRRTPSWN